MNPKSPVSRIRSFHHSSLSWAKADPSSYLQPPDTNRSNNKTNMQIKTMLKMIMTILSQLIVTGKKVPQATPHLTTIMASQITPKWVEGRLQSIKCSRTRTLTRKREAVESLRMTNTTRYQMIKSRSGSTFFRTQSHCPRRRRKCLGIEYRRKSQEIRRRKSSGCWPRKLKFLRINTRNYMT